MKTKTDLAWEDICSVSTYRLASSETPSVVTRPAHPFEKLGPKPYKFVGLDHAPEGVRRSCALCGKSIKNLYSIECGDGCSYTLGSECILSIGNGFERHLVGQVKFVKTRYEKLQKEKRRVKQVADALEVSLRDYREECRFLHEYNGNFSFYLSLRNQLHYNGCLSEKQWACLTREVEKKNAPKAAVPARVFSLNVGTTIIVTKFFAQIIGRDTGLNRPHFSLEVLGVEGETEKAYKLTGKLSAHRTAHCCVCGLALTNPVSVQAGIGPICADRYEVSTVEQLQAKLATEYKTTLTLWVPKSQIKERKVL